MEEKSFEDRRMNCKELDDHSITIADNPTNLLVDIQFLPLNGKSAIREICKRLSEITESRRISSNVLRLSHSVLSKNLTSLL